MIFWSLVRARVHKADNRWLSAFFMGQAFCLLITSNSKAFFSISFDHIEDLNNPANISFFRLFK